MLWSHGDKDRRPSTVERFYSAYAVENFAQAAKRGASSQDPPSIAACLHNSEPYTNAQGVGPLCPHCGGLWTRRVARHIRPEPHWISRVVLKPVWGAICRAVLVVLAWGAMIKDYARR